MSASPVLREGIVADADLIDAGVIFGTGFAPFRGGPLTYARARGIEACANAPARARAALRRALPGRCRLAAAGRVNSQRNA